MSLTINADSGSASANSLVTEAEMIAYAATRLNAPDGWTTFQGTTCTESEKAAIIEAGRDLAALEYKGARSSETQAMPFPRYQCPKPDSYTYYDSDEIPQRAKDAQMEMAWQYIRAGTTDLASQDANRGVIQKVVGPLSTTWESAAARPTGMARFPRVQKLLAPLLSGSGSSLRVIRG